MSSSSLGGGEACLALKLLVTFSALAIVAAYVDIEQVLSLMHGQNALAVGFAGIAVLVQIGLGSLRWRAVLAASAHQNAARISPIVAFRLFYASIFFNSFLPGTFGGDVVRRSSTRALGVTTGASVHSVVLDRIITLAVLFAMAVPALPLVWGGIGLGWSGTAIFVGVGLVVLALAGYLMLSKFGRFSSAMHYVERVIISFFVASKNLLSSPGELLIALPLAYAAHAAYCIAAFLLARSLHIEMSILDALTLFPLVLLFSSVPISIGGWGVREFGAIGLLGLISVSSQQAVAISLQFGVVSLLMSLPGAIFWLGTRGRSTEAI